MNIQNGRIDIENGWMDIQNAMHENINLSRDIVIFVIRDFVSQWTTIYSILFEPLHVCWPVYATCISSVKEDY